MYQSFATTGRAPDVGQLSTRCGLSEADTRDALRRLHDGRHLVLDGQGAIVMAHPFSAVPLGFAVMGPTTLWWGGCAWDSFALPHLVPDAPEVLVATTCPACGAALAWRVGLAAWLERTEQERGCVMDLATLWNLARGWYQGRLARGYVRREPEEAVGYFRSVGLTGPFWEP